MRKRRMKAFTNTIDSLLNSVLTPDPSALQGNGFWEIRLVQNELAENATLRERFSKPAMARLNGAVRT